MVLILPIRNWNPAMVYLLSTNGSCFDPTYKELKLIWLYTLCNPFIRFDPTYKELKQELNKYYRRTEMVLILPIRNWNLNTPNLLNLTFFVLILPIRNWNFCGEQGAGKTIAVLILPIRNWNISFKRKNNREVTVLILPIRNWNWSSSILLLTSAAFWSYL